ncbi:MAG: TetR/AcrR family transcriptional regulator C-terminal domain-containing protein [Actinomycetota bacterium]
MVVTGQPPEAGGRRDRPPLTRAAIIGAAIELADHEGIGALSMRKLAATLGFEVMSLYNHVANKTELLAAMVDEVAADIVPLSAMAADDDPIQGVRAVALAMREVLVEHRWASDLWLGHVPGPFRTAAMELLLERLAALDVSEHVEHVGFHAVNNHVLGYTIQAQAMDVGMASEGADQRIHQYMAQLAEADAPRMAAHVQQHLDGDTGSSFEIVLDFILDGLVGLDHTERSPSTLGVDGGDSDERQRNGRQRHDR